MGVGAFLGAPALMAEAANRVGKAHGGLLGYLPHLPGALRFRSRVRIVADGDAWEQEVAALEVANGPSGGGLPVNPGARVDDGVLDLLVVGARSLPGTLRVASAVPSGRHTGLRGVTVRRVSRVALDGEDVLLAVDGEILGVLPATIEVCPGAVEIIVP
jgi:diacylglycerol kinase (ATP)